MTPNSFCFLQNRAVVHVSGSDSADFLQGLISNDMTRVGPDRAIWAAFLTPQGKFLHEFMVAHNDDGFVLECELERRDDLITRLSRFRLRANVTISPSDEYAVGVAWGADSASALGLSAQAGHCASRDGVLAFVDPRLASAGVRLIGPKENIERLVASTESALSTQDRYDAHRIDLGLPDGSRDMEIEKALLLENGFEELGGVDFEKGCYIGQELTARTHYRALIKKRLLPVHIEGEAPPPGTKLTIDGADAGEMKSSTQGHGLALVRLAPWQNSPDGILIADNTKLTPSPPAWINLPDQAKS